MKTLNRIYLVILLSFQWNYSQSQINLVPNGDFESYSSCPTNLHQITSAQFWFQPYIPSSSTDYFNSCNGNVVGVPNNILGHQNALSGNGYVGISTYSGGFDVREYIEIGLLDTLESNTKYCLRMFVSPADSINIFSDGIAGYFSNDSVLYTAPPFGLLSLPAQVQNDSGNIVSDIIGWTLIEGEFFAIGGERFLTIGNFNNDATTNTIPAQPTSLVSYFYIDDVSVTEGSCNVGIDENAKLTLSIFISPNPTKDHFQIIVPEKNFNNLTYRIYGIDGKLVNDGILQRNATLVQSLEWPSGLYLVQVFDVKGNISTKKVVKL